MDKPKQEPHPGPAGARTEGKRPLVLLIEDDQDLRETTALLLEDEGYEVRAVEHGMEALRQLWEGPLPGVIILDLLMPVMNGWEFRAHQKRDPRLATVPVVVISGILHEQPEQYPASLFPPETAVLRKPFSISELLEKVQRYCAPPPPRS